MLIIYLKLELRTLLVHNYTGQFLQNQKITLTIIKQGFKIFIKKFIFSNYFFY